MLETFRRSVPRNLGLARTASSGTFAPPRMAPATPNFPVPPSPSYTPPQVPVHSGMAGQRHTPASSSVSGATAVVRNLGYGQAGQGQGAGGQRQTVPAGQQQHQEVRGQQRRFAQQQNLPPPYAAQPFKKPRE